MCSRVGHPQQNLAVERKHQHLLNVARALMFQSKIPIDFWSERILTAHLINRVPAAPLHDESPFRTVYERT
ncbi:hypothetical protein OSB04_005484 [Centaurea solstitialis]|uniref:Integrase catalytic domain-containing protein n=1 Tax=Centaurea solstitialis TaxID=347529 RepID=A0AA38TG47_9ASTR|nr:hypothetical protein OSB04_005484 [Centaurea solstitialis]